VDGCGVHLLDQLARPRGGRVVRREVEDSFGSSTEEAAGPPYTQGVH
jgi:hypothetical protein